METFQKKYCQVSVTSILLKYAAILILPIIIAAGGWYFYIASEKQISDNLALGDAIQPGIPKATLILAGNDKQSLTPTYPTPVKVNHSTTAIAQKWCAHLSINTQYKYRYTSKTAA